MPFHIWEHIHNAQKVYKSLVIMRIEIYGNIYYYVITRNGCIFIGGRKNDNERKGGSKHSKRN